MKYINGTQLDVGDKVLIGGVYKGLVVADIDSDGYSDGYPREQWDYLQEGVLIDIYFGGLAHYEGCALETEKIVLVSA